MILRVCAEKSVIIRLVQIMKFFGRVNKFICMIWCHYFSFVSLFVHPFIFMAHAIHPEAVEAVVTKFSGCEQ